VIGIAGNGDLLFSSDRLGATSIWMMDPVARTEPVVVKQELGAVIPIGITRNGSLFYHSPSGIVDVFLAEIDLATGSVTSPPAPLTQRSNGRNTYPTWSPDGGRLLFHSIPSMGPAKFIIYDRTQKQFREVSHHLLQAQRPIWTPDGQSIFVRGAEPNGRKGHFAIEPETGTATLVFPFSLTESGGEGAWSPDGRYFFNRPNDWARGIYRIDARTNEKKILYVPPKDVSIGLENLAPSPDGRWLAFHAAGIPNGGSSLMLIPVEGGDAKPLHSIRDPERFAFGAFTWSPDSKSILAARGSDKKQSLWIVPLDGTAPRKTALDHSEMRLPRLNPDGKTISFSAGSRSSEIWALEHFLPESDKR
jgi:Tol biopolymer transport system component